MLRGTKQVCLMVKHHAETFGFVALFVLFPRLKVHISHSHPVSHTSPAQANVRLHAARSPFTATKCHFILAQTVQPILCCWCSCKIVLYPNVHVNVNTFVLSTILNKSDIIWTASQSLLMCCQGISRCMWWPEMFGVILTCKDFSIQCCLPSSLHHYILCAFKERREINEPGYKSNLNNEILMQPLIDQYMLHNMLLRLNFQLSYDSILFFFLTLLQIRSETWE